MRLGPWEISLFLVLVLLLPSLAVYFVPVIIAVVRHAKSMLGIILLNIFAGWTFFGWIGALIWSIIGEKQAPLDRNTLPPADGFCPKCGAKVLPGSEYCSHCGTKLPG